MTRTLMGLAERAWLPDPVIRRGIRVLLGGRLRALDAGASKANYLGHFVEQMDGSPIAVSVRDANQQHYEVPAMFFERVLGPRLKYSCALWETPQTTLEEAERAMLALTCARAALVDGHRILELGCGWGSLSLWMAQQYPSSEVIAVSNSQSQRFFIEERARALDLSNLRVVTADMNEYFPHAPVDRIVSVEMFEHMRNHRRLLRRMAGWLAPGGRAFVHVFCHRQWPYFFEALDDSDWMARHFFTGGMMPSASLVEAFADALQVEERWTVNGTHYARTVEAWLHRLDSARDDVERLFGDTYGGHAAVWVQRWRLFLLSCAELFAYRNGEEWFVAHYRLAHASPKEAGA